MNRLPRDHIRRRSPPHARASRSPSPTSLRTRWDSLPARADAHASTDSSPRSYHRHSPPKTKTKSRARAKGKVKFLKHRPSFLGVFFSNFRRRRTNANGAPGSAALAGILQASPAGGDETEYEDEGAYEYDGAGASGSDNRVAAAMGARLGAEGDPFKTPPRTPTSARTDMGGSPAAPPLSPISTNSPSSSRSAGGARARKRRRARLMSRMKLVQVLGPEASGAVTRKMGGGDF